MEAIKTVVIGAGMMGYSQIRNCLEPLTDYDITAVCEVYEPNIRRINDYFTGKGKTVPVYRDYRELLEKEEFSLAVIVTPDYLHEEIAVACLRAGKHIRLEKPMATTVGGLKNVMDACREHPECIVQIGYELRYADVIVKMRNSLPQIGSPKMIWCHEFRHPFLKKEGLIPDWIRKKEYSGGTLLEKNCHHFDLFNMIADAKPLRVYAAGDNSVEYRDTDVLDHAFVTVDYENGMRANLSLCMFCPELKGQKHMHALEIGVIGDRGRLEIRDDDLYVWDREAKREEHYAYLRDNFEAHSEDILPSLRELARCIREKRQPLTDVRTGLQSALLALAAETSAHEQRIVTIQEMEEAYGISYGGES